MERCSFDVGKIRHKTVVLLLAFLPFIQLLGTSYAHSSELKVCKTCEIATLHQAIELAHAGDSITVEAGEYQENKIAITSPLKIVGKPGAIIDGKREGFHIFLIEANNVTISGFTIRNGGMSYLQELAGIRVINSEDCTIEGNTFEDTTYGIYFEKSKKCSVLKNKFRGQAKDEASGGNGIHVWQGEEITIEGNDIRGHRDGVYFEFVKNALMRNNFVSHNIRYGLHFMSSNDCRYFENTFSDNGAGVAVMYSRRIEMYRNSFLTNRGVASYGLLLKEIHDGKIQQNIFNLNTVGIFMEGSNRNLFRYNKFQSNGTAIRVMGDCEDNNFTENNLLFNTFDVATNSDRNPNTFSENYWTTYDGYDLNHDGVGDVPYRPVSLSSVILENVDSSFILLKSFLFNLLDQIERSLPELTPQRLKDEKPRMKPVEIPHD